MKKAAIAIGVVVAIIVAGVLVWMVLSSNAANAPANTSAVSGAVDMTAQATASVTMHDLSFSPEVIKIKKGTKVTWTNQDTVAHNVVAADASKTGGLPTDSPTFGRGGTFSFTFDTVGTFNYLCIPHKAFMHGTVQVVE